jgi:hypothetical protein
VKAEQEFLFGVILQFDFNFHARATDSGCIDTGNTGESASSEAATNLFIRLFVLYDLTF